MISQIFSTVISFFIIYGILNLFRYKKRKQVEWKGRPNTKAEQKRIDKQMKEFIESHPDHSFFKDNPEYLEKYLNEIDLKELNL